MICLFKFNCLLSGTNILLLKLPFSFYLPTIFWLDKLFLDLEFPFLRDYLNLLLFSRTESKSIQFLSYDVTDCDEDYAFTYP